MRLDRLDLTRFGHFTGLGLDFGARPEGSDLHIVHGPNEAGKTTVMEGYLRLLYGFSHREPYAFRHSPDTLEVGGRLDLGGRALEAVRLKRRRDSLRDPRGEVLPEGALSAALGGIGLEDYRKMLCLDDATIEAGGEEILASEGEIGRLLFSAAAGIGRLTRVLEDAGGEARGLYHKGASKTAHAALERERKEIEAEIRRIDTSASAYRELRRADEAARRAEAEARAAREALEAEQARLSALAAAHPLAAELGQVEAGLAPLAGCPAGVGIPAEELDRLSADRAGQAAARARAEAAAEAAREARAALVLRPGLAALADRLDALAPLRARVAAAAEDLPKRIRRRDELLGAMRARLADLDAGAEEDPRAWLLPEARIARLERLAKGLDSAEVEEAAAAREAEAAARALSRAEAALAERAPADAGGTGLAALLAEHDAPRLMTDLREARAARDRARAEAEARLAALAVSGEAPREVPPPTVGVARARALGQALAEAAQEARAAARTDEDAAARRAAAAARLAELSQTPEARGAAEAEAARAERDRLWAAHRAALDAGTAEAFAAALARDDAAVDLLLAGAGERARRLEAALSEAEARAAHEAATEAAARARARHEAAAADLAAAAGAAGLPGETAAEDLVAWAEARDAAAAADQTLRATEAALAPVEAAAEALRAVLGERLADPAAPVERLVRAAEARAGEARAEAASRQAAEDAVAEKRAAADARAQALSAATARREAAASALSEAACDLLPAPVPEPRDALAALRGLRETGAELGGIERQIAGMEADRAALAQTLDSLEAEAARARAPCDGERETASRPIVDSPGARGHVPGVWPEAAPTGGAADRAGARGDRVAAPAEQATPLSAGRDAPGRAARDAGGSAGRAAGPSAKDGTDSIPAAGDAPGSGARVGEAAAPLVSEGDDRLATRPPAASGPAPVATGREGNTWYPPAAASADRMPAGEQAPGEAVDPGGEAGDTEPHEGMAAVLARHDTLAEAVRAACAASDRAADLDTRIAAAEAEARAAAGRLAEIDARVAALAAVFPEGIETGTPEDLRRAVARAAEADRLRRRTADLARRLAAGLGAGSVEEARAALEDHPEETVQARLAALGPECAAAVAAHEAAIAERAAAADRRARLAGDDRVAALVERRRTIEAEMEEALLGHLELALGGMLADRALARYRDAHRSRLLAEAEAAFATLTDGAYDRLTTQPGAAGGETLLAISAGDGAARAADQLSKGTRFQLYLALRAAAYRQMAENGTVLPFFCDDIFETFDEARTTAACRLMWEIGRIGQAIYLTHHAHVVQIAKDLYGDRVRVHRLGG